LYLKHSIITYTLLSLVIFTQLGVTTPPKSKIIFGVKIGLLHNSSLTSFVAFSVKNDIIMGSQVLSEKELLHIGCGKWPILGSNQFVNFFKNENLDIYPVINQNTFKEELYCNAFDSLWKIRFKEHPFSKYPKQGWSNGKFKPSPKQLEYISNTYGVQNFEHDYFLDTSFFKIMRDVQDSTWIVNYRKLF